MCHNSTTWKGQGSDSGTAPELAQLRPGLGKIWQDQAHKVKAPHTWSNRQSYKQFLPSETWNITYLMHYILPTSSVSSLKFAYVYQLDEELSRNTYSQDKVSLCQTAGMQQNPGGPGTHTHWDTFQTWGPGGRGMGSPISNSPRLRESCCWSRIHFTLCLKEPPGVWKTQLIISHIVTKH